MQRIEILESKEIAEAFVCLLCSPDVGAANAVVYVCLAVALQKKQKIGSEGLAAILVRNHLELVSLAISPVVQQRPRRTE